MGGQQYSRVDYMDNLLRRSVSGRICLDEKVQVPASEPTSFVALRARLLEGGHCHVPCQP